LREHLAPSVDEFAVAFFKATPAYLQLLREKFTSMRDPNRCDERQDILAEIFIGIHTIGSEAARAKLNAASRVCSALEAVLKRFMEPASSCSPSSFQSLVPALDTIEAICRFGTDLDVVNPPLRLLVVDDDAVARRTLSGALQLAVARPDSADCGEAALALAAERPYDLIFLDVIMPGMDGFAACTRLHELPLHRQTPVVFITSHDDTNSRAEAVASGGCGFIPKPVLPCEVLLLALTHGIRGRLERGKEVAVAPPVESVLAG
jgi:CheY-like chemotaxis protein